jgi:hypothetical protein
VRASAAQLAKYLSWRKLFRTGVTEENETTFHAQYTFSVNLTIMQITGTVVIRNGEESN